MVLIRIIKTLAAIAISLLTIAFGFRAYFYQRFPIGINEPYNAADVLDSLLMLLVFGSAAILAVVSVLKSLFPGVQGRRWGLRGCAVALLVAGLYLPVHKLATHVASSLNAPNPSVGSFSTGSRSEVVVVPRPRQTQVCRFSRATPNPSLKRSANGRPPGPVRRYAVHFRQPGPGVLPSSPA